MNFSLHQRTALHAAVRGGHKDIMIVKYLVGKKSDIINMHDNDEVSTVDGVSTVEAMFVFI